MKIRTVMATVVAVTFVGLATESVQAQLQNNLFPQYYTQGAGQSTAEMYPSPHWVPPHVGHTYGTYQPLMPHEFMYQHSRNYYNFYGSNSEFYQHPCTGKGGGSGLTKTTVRWQSGCNFMAPLGGLASPFAGLSAKLAKHRYSKPLSGCGCDGGCDTGCYDESWGGGCDSGGCAANLNGQYIKR
jgi:hypothetical protein